MKIAFLSFALIAGLVSLASGEDPVVWQQSTAQCVRLSIRDKNSALERDFEATFTIEGPQHVSTSTKVLVRDGHHGYAMFPFDFGNGDIDPTPPPGHYHWSASVNGKTVVSGGFDWIMDTHERGLRIKYSDN